MQNSLRGRGTNINGNWKPWAWEYQSRRRTVKLDRNPEKKRSGHRWVLAIDGKWLPPVKPFC
jgi:hypothetical protein